MTREELNEIVSKTIKLDPKLTMDLIGIYLENRNEEQIELNGDLYDAETYYTDDFVRRAKRLCVYHNFFSQVDMEKVKGHPKRINEFNLGFQWENSNEGGDYWYDIWIKDKESRR